MSLNNILLLPIILMTYYIDLYNPYRFGSRAHTLMQPHKRLYKPFFKNTDIKTLISSLLVCHVHITPLTIKYPFLHCNLW